MPPLQDIILHGASYFEIADSRRETRRVRGLDALRVSYHTTSKDTFAAGGAAPDDPYMRIQEDEVQEEVPDQSYTHSLTCHGILGGSPHKLESDEITETDEGWDSGPQVWITTLPDSYEIGQSHPNHDSLILREVTKTNLDGTFYRIACDYKGLLGDKPKKRRMTVDGREVQASSPMILPPIGSAQLYTLKVPRVVLVDIYVSTEEPDTLLLGRQLDEDEYPDDLPEIAPFQWQNVTADLRFNYPRYWRLESLQAEKIGSSNPVWLINQTWVYAPLLEPL